MSQGPTGDGLNAHHRRVLGSRLAGLDEVLVEIETIASGAASGGPFPRYKADVSPVQLDLLAGHLAELRARLKEAATVLGARSIEATSALRAILVQLEVADIALADVAPARLRGYGELGPEAAASVEHLLTDLERRIRRAQVDLARGLDADLAARVERLEHVPIDVDALRALEAAITRHGLVEFRGALEGLVERLERRWVEIAVFGRVSAGKSTLLNTVLDMDVLPVGVTPVTAVPTRVGFGEPGGVSVSFADAPNETVPVARVAEFVSEAANPGNRRRVTRVVVRVPSPHLRSDMVLVDTPGVGALAASGARESYAYLPRCDLGIVLIDAGSGPGADDIDLLRRLVDSEIPAMVVLTKADLLDSADRERMREYVRREVARGVDRELRVHVVSSRGAEAAAVRAWFADEVVPLSARARELAAASARRRLGALLGGVTAALRAMERTASGRHAADAERRALVERLAGEGEAELRRASTACRALVETVYALANPTLTTAARAIVQGAREGRRVAASATVVAVMAAAADERATALTGRLREARERMSSVLAALVQEGGGPPAAVDSRLSLDLLGRPALTIPAEIERLDLRLPRWARALPALGERRVRVLLQSAVGAPVSDAFNRFAPQLRDWASTTLGRLGEQFAAEVEPHRAQARRLASGVPGAGVDPAALRRDLEALERYAGDPSTGKT